MTRWRQRIARLSGLIPSRRRDSELDEEVEAHLEFLAQEHMRRGLSREDAGAAARRAFGGVVQMKETYRDQRGWPMLFEFAQDVRYAGRMLMKSPAFAAVAVLTLAVGIGAATAMFSVADSALLNPLPLPEPDRLVTVNEIVPLISERPMRLSAPDLLDYEGLSHAFDALGGWTPRSFELSGVRESERVFAVRATASLFAVLRVAPAMGRAFSAAEDRRGAKVCVISDGLWRRWFGADRAALGATVHLDRVPYQVIGIMPRTFTFPLPGASSAPAADLWVPMSMTPAELGARGDSWDYNGIARMKQGVTAAQATDDVNAIAQHIARDLMPPDPGGVMTIRALVQPLAAQVSGTVRPLVLALLGAVLCVLLIACVNVANLLLARGAHREREMAVRAALGASRVRLVRQLVAEALVFAVLAALGGGLLAWWSTSALAPIIPARFAVLGQARINWHALLFTGGVAIATAILVSIVPALAATRDAPAGPLAARGASADVRQQRLRSSLVVAETALAIVLLVAAGLLSRSFRDLLTSRAGFEAEGAAAGSISLPEHEYPDAAGERRFYRELLERLRALPGVDFTGVGTNLPLSGRHFERAFTPDEYDPPPDARLNIAGMTTVGGEYLQAIGASVIRGQYFTPQDDAAGAPVAIVTQSLARQYWPGQDPIGRRVKFGIGKSPMPWLTVVGMVSDVKDALDASSSVQIFVPADQVEHTIPANLQPAFTIAQLRSMFVAVRGRGSAAALAAGVRESVHAIDERLAIANLAPLADTVSQSAAPQRFNMLLMGGFAAIALLLAAIGIYSVMAYSVAQRTQEIGIRMALGADGGALVRMVVRTGVRLAVLGVMIGIAAAAALAPLLTALLFGVKPLDVPTFASVALGMLAVAALATYVPARRAAQMDPLLALRAD